MARIRTIKPEFPQSESMGRVSREARLCFVLLWTVLDDEGRARGSSRMLASLLYPYDDDAPRKIEGWLKELEQENCIVRYKIEDDSYIASSNWLKHQKIDRPSVSRLPPPPERSSSRREHSRDFDADLGPSTKDLGSGPSTEEESSSEPSASSLGIPPQSIFISIPTNRNGAEFNVLDTAVEDYLATYPAVDVRQELREMRRWALDNPTKRKTYAGMGRFINFWLGKEQDKNHGLNGNGHANGQGRKPTARGNFIEGAAQYLAELEAQEPDGALDAARPALPAAGHT